MQNTPSTPDGHQLEAEAGATPAARRLTENARVACGSFAKVTRVKIGFGPRRPAPARVSGGSVHIRFAEAPNPYFAREHAEGRDNPRTIEAAWNTNESPLVRMTLKGTIDARQAAAGHLFRRLYETMAGGLPSPSRIQERVDGGGAPDVFTERRARAARQLAAAAEAIGPEAYYVVAQVCGDGLSLNDLARRAGTRKTTARQALRDALDALGEAFGLGRPKRDG